MYCLRSREICGRTSVSLALGQETVEFLWKNSQKVRSERSKVIVTWIDIADKFVIYLLTSHTDYLVFYAVVKQIYILDNPDILYNFHYVHILKCMSI